MSRWKSVFTAVVLVGCGRAQEPSARGVQPVASEEATPGPRTWKPAADAAPWRDVPRTRLVLQGMLDYRIVTLGDPPAIGARIAERHHRKLAAHDGGDQLITGVKGEQSLSLHDLAAGRTWSLTLPDAVEPFALHVVGASLWVGAGGRLGFVDLQSDDAIWYEVVEATLATGKAYDVFARAGDWLVGIDDILRPFYATSVRIDAAGRPVDAVRWNLPALVNGSYTHAVLARQGDEGVLHALTSLGSRTTWGQHLFAMPVRAGERFVAGAIRSSWPQVSEGVRQSEPVPLLVGDERTPWTGLARVEEPARTLLAAGARGLIVLSEPYNPKAATAVDLGGPVSDVLVDGDHVWVLLKGPSPALLGLDRSLKERTRVALDDPYDTFVR